ncbi:MAG: extracellular solute-binding protein [Treponema sp.]|nr:extracellular solute-binding protein [Treponema sp.]
MKRIIGILCACLLIAGMILAVSCKKTDPNAGSQARTTSTEKLTLWVYDSGRIEVLTELGKKYQEQFGVAVEVSMVDLGQVRNQFLLSAGGAECADIAIIPHDNLGPLVENSVVQEINLGSKRSSYLDPALEGFSYNGKLYGVPLAVENIGFFYNPSLVPTPPATWDEAIAVSTALKNQGKIDYMFGCPDATYNVYPVYDCFGGSIFGKNPDGSLNGKQVLLADSGFVAGLDFLVRMVKQGLVPQTIDWDGAHVLFESGRAPFCPTGPWALNRFKESGVPYAIAKFPAARAGGQPGNPFLGVQGMIINSTSPRRLLAQSFAVDFIAREESMMAIFRAEQRPSAWKSIFESAGDNDTRNFNAAGVSAVPMPSIPEMGYVWDAWVAAAALAFSGERSSADALRNAKSQIEALSN